MDWEARQGLAALRRARGMGPLQGSGRVSDCGL